MKITRTALLLAALTVLASGCDRSVTLLAPEVTIFTEVLTGTVAPPVGDTLQRATHPFTVGQTGGDVTVTLTSAVQTLPDGSLVTNMSMGLGVGTMVGGVCQVAVTAYVTTRPATTPQLGGGLNPGTYCVQVSDITVQTGPVAFSVTVTHP
jgi:hypothetical protein